MKKEEIKIRLTPEIKKSFKKICDIKNDTMSNKIHCFIEDELKKAEKLHSYLLSSKLMSGLKANEITKKWIGIGFIENIEQEKTALAMELLAMYMLNPKNKYPTIMETIAFPAVVGIFRRIDYDMDLYEIFDLVIKILDDLTPKYTAQTFVFKNGEPDLEAIFLTDYSDNYPLTKYEK